MATDYTYHMQLMVLPLGSEGLMCVILVCGKCTLEHICSVGRRKKPQEGQPQHGQLQVSSKAWQEHDTQVWSYTGEVKCLFRRARPALCSTTMCACTMTEHLCERGEKLGCLMFPEHATVSVQRAKRIFQVLLLYMCHEDSEVHGLRESSTTTSAPYLSNEGTRKTFNTTQTEYPLAVYCKPPCLICYMRFPQQNPSNKQVNKTVHYSTGCVIISVCTITLPFQ